MSANPVRSWFSPELRLALFYLLALAMPGVTAAYFGIWLDDKGLSAGEIGWINSAPIFLTLIFNISVGRFADRAGDWRSVIVLGAVLSGVASIGLFFMHGFWSILIIMTATILPFNLVQPVLDAASMRLTRRNGSNFAFVRAFGTVGYMLALAGVALAVDMLGGDAFVPILCGIIIIRSVFSFLLPRFRTQPSNTVQAHQTQTRDGPVEAITTTAPVGPIQANKLVDVMKPWFLAPVFAFALVQGLHYVLGAFGGVVWRANGIPEVWVGPLIAFGAVAEVLMMFLFKRVTRRFGARHLILFAMLVSAFRWGAMTLNPPLFVLVLLQLLHGITFGLSYLGLMNFITNWTSEDVAAEAQSFATAVQLGVVVVTVSGFGYLVDGLGLISFAAGVVSSLVAALLVFWSLHSMPTAETTTP